MITEFWETLFDARERTCFSKDIYGTTVYTPYNDNYGEIMTFQFFSINPLKKKRSDADVECFRNILIEFDGLPLTEQLMLSNDIPFSTLTFSGGKSYHYIISLEKPCLDIKEYKALVKRIYNKLPDCDRSTGNPSRLSRTPGAMRGGIEQTLITVRRRISRAELEAWLGPEIKPKTEERVIAPMGPGKRRLLPARTLAFMEYGAQEGGRNVALFINACELFRANYTKEEVMDIALRVLDLPATEIRQCVTHAQKAVSNE